MSEIKEIQFQASNVDGADLTHPGHLNVFYHGAAAPLRITVNADPRIYEEKTRKFLKKWR